MDKYEVFTVVIVGIVFFICIASAASIGKVKAAAQPCIDAIETKDIEIIRAVCGHPEVLAEDETTIR